MNYFVFEFFKHIEIVSLIDTSSFSTNSHDFTKEDIYKNDPLLQQMIDNLNKHKEERQRYVNNDQSLVFRKYVNKGTRSRENAIKTFWDGIEHSREWRSRIETGATHYPCEHLITSLTA
ncbi:unnamed protein product [Heterobilharzia americana]|nr:unnamed protein product [Heterobilharzia americana]